ncbi:MAG: thiamine pyrophosphate-binding protein, partial [Acidimicrobiales bacterium]
MTRILSGAEVLLEVLETERVRFVFGNPGTTELPLIDALSGRDTPEYVLGLHETVSVGMADGYARATGRPSFVNLHTSAGLGNAMGVLSNVRATRTPMVVTAGQQDRRHLLAEPFLTGNLTEMANGLMKWVAEVNRTADLGKMLRRAFNAAGAPPSGPVFLSIPMDVLSEQGHLSVPPRSRVELRAVPTELGELAARVRATPRERFGIVASDEVASCDAGDALVAVAERLGCIVY